MTILESELHFRLSGGSGNASPAASLGGVMSTSTDIVDNTAENLFDHTSGPEATAGRVEYRAFYVFNDNDTLVYQGAKIWIDSETSHTNANLQMALDLAGVNATGDSVTLETDAPDPALTFVEANGEGNALTLGNIPANGRYMVWVKRTITAGVLAKNNYSTVFKIKGSSAEA